ncbi:MAG TPA: TIGR04255 family protein [Terracidiphilus sp.]|jgi:uncharacterized protein (TIGR04255 family)
MPNMPNAPLIYTVGVVRFPRVPGIGKYAGALLEAVRGTYPQFDDFTLSFVRANINLNPEEKTEIDRGEVKLFQFASPDRKWGLFLTEEVLGLHTSAYIHNEDFVAKFKEGLQAFLSIPELRIEWMEAVGIRYVDLVRPRPGELLDDYLYPWVLPPKPDIGDEMDLLQGMYVAAYKTAFGELRFQSLRKPPFVLPMDLNNPAVLKNGWAIPALEGDFAVMDMDHGCRFIPLEPIDVDVICDKLRELRSISRKLFDQTGKEHAKSVWKGEVS